MRVAFFVYPSAFQNKGGGEIVLEKHEEYLLKKNIDIKRFDMWNDKIQDFDILHVFGSVKDCLPLMQVAKARGVKVVLESIFWSDFRRAFFEDGSAKDKMEKIVRHFIKVAFPFFPSGRKKMFEVADMIVPNSINEGKQIARLFNVPISKMFVVPNGVDSKFAYATADMFERQYGMKDFVLSVGRIEPRKNQLNLIKAVKGLDKELAIIGAPVSGYEWYYESCLKEASGNVKFLGAMSHESDMLTSAYAACDIFVLQGWFETPGLAAMEAALAGAKVIATLGGSTKEYFSNKVFYLDPSSPSDIRRKIGLAVSTNKSPELRNYMMNNYTWEKVVDKMIEGYRKVMGK
ncbi:MAG TPA: glycosyltransferase [Candidatus Omnitrophota bacterium]|nr:glycosyltransferase [Candidatus Omnitrophota bacterium]